MLLIQKEESRKCGSRAPEDWEKMEGLGLG